MLLILVSYILSVTLVVVAQMPKFSENVVEITPDIFHDQIAQPHSSEQIDDSTWFIFSDISTCGAKCRNLDEVIEELASETDSTFALQKVKIAHIACGKYHYLCQRLGVFDYPKLTLLQNSELQDYSGSLEHDVLVKFIQTKGFKAGQHPSNSKTRQLEHEWSLFENFEKSYMELARTVWHFFELSFGLIGLGDVHIRSKFIVVMCIVLTPLVLFACAVVKDSASIKTTKRD